MTKGRLYESRIEDQGVVHFDLDVSSSAYNRGCVINGSNTMAQHLCIIIIVSSRNS